MRSFLILACTLLFFTSISQAFTCYPDCADCNTHGLTPEQFCVDCSAYGDGCCIQFQPAFGGPNPPNTGCPSYSAGGGGGGAPELNGKNAAAALLLAAAVMVVAKGLRKRRRTS